MKYTREQYKHAIKKHFDNKTKSIKFNQNQNELVETFDKEHKYITLGGAEIHGTYLDAWFFHGTYCEGGKEEFDRLEKLKAFI